MWVCVCVCVCVYVYIYIHTKLGCKLFMESELQTEMKTKRAYICYTYTCAHNGLHLHVYVYCYWWLLFKKCIYIYIYTHMYIYIYMYIHLILHNIQTMVSLDVDLGCTHVIECISSPSLHKKDPKRSFLFWGVGMKVSRDWQIWRSLRLQAGPWLGNPQCWLRFIIYRDMSGSIFDGLYHS